MEQRLTQHQVNAKNEQVHKLLEVMLAKRTRLIVAADLVRGESLLRMAQRVGPYCAMFKTHIDCIEDFTPTLIDDLQELAHKHQFLLFEDRKIADIGKTSQHQFAQGLYRIAQWADVVTVHGLLGEGVLDALRPLCLQHDCALLLLAQLSNRGNLVDDAYAQSVLAMGHAAKDIVLGFVAQEPLSIESGLIKCTPGIHLDARGDGLDQQYRTPKEALETGSDCLIVGRAITQSADPAKAAKAYQQGCWD
jgi:orotidine 5'-phosphate decarboxylase subfamily 1